MKKIIIALVAAVAVSTTALAQNERRGERPRMDRTEMVKRQTERTVQDLGLTEEQAEALLKLNTEYADKNVSGRGMRPGTGQGPRREFRPNAERPSQEEIAEARKEMEKTRAEYNAELKKILTEEQYAKYEQLQKERVANMHRGGMRQGQRDGARRERR